MQALLECCHLEIESLEAYVEMSLRCLLEILFIEHLENKANTTLFI